MITETVLRAGVSATIPKTFVKLLRDAAVLPHRQDVMIANLKTSPRWPSMWWSSMLATTP